MIECIDFKEINKGVLVGFANVFVPKWGIEIFNIQLCRKNDQAWVNFPSREFIDKEGIKKFLPYFRFQNKEMGEFFQSKVMEAINEFRAKSLPPEEPNHEEVPF